MENFKINDPAHTSGIIIKITIISYNRLLNNSTQLSSWPALLVRYNTDVTYDSAKDTYVYNATHENAFYLRKSEYRLAFTKQQKQ